MKPRIGIAIKQQMLFNARVTSALCPQLSRYSRFCFEQISLKGPINGPRRGPNNGEGEGPNQGPWEGPNKVSREEPDKGPREGPN